MHDTTVDISVCMIVKNEEMLLARALESVEEADEIIICDTGSDDNTIEIAKQYTDKVFTDFVWCDDFASARNHAIEKATGDWILSIDADEVLESGGMEIFRELINNVPKDCRCINCQIKSEDGKQNFQNARFYYKDVRWVGKIHNHLNVKPTINCDATIIFGYSPAHKKDPDRAMRILKKVVAEEPNCIRERYYLGREYWYRRQWQKAIDTFVPYFKKSKYIAERADAYLIQARCLWALGRGDDARESCMYAILNNANFKEALLFMAEMHWPHNAKTWKKWAEHCTNENVLFVRNEQVKERDG